MPKMRAVQVPYAKGPFELVEREIPEPGPRQVRIKVQACGICHSDSFAKDGLFPGIKYPRVPGHEVAGIIDKVGPDSFPWEKGQRVGVGWHGGMCGYCEPCRRGDFITCENHLVCGISFDGGYAEYMVAPVDALAHIPDELAPSDAAPLLCAGITTFNALRNSGARGGDVVAILGVGGLGHLAVQFANKMGFKTVAIARGKDKEALCKKLGAHVYIDSEKMDVAKELLKLGGAKVILATVTNPKVMGPTIDGLRVDGKLIVVGVSGEPLEVSPLQLIRARKHVEGWPSGTSIDSEDTLKFCALCGARSMNQIFPLEKAQEAYDLMMSGKARFRIVLTTGL